MSNRRKLTGFAKEMIMVALRPAIPLPMLTRTSNTAVYVNTNDGWVKIGELDNISLNTNEFVDYAHDCATL